MKDQENQLIDAMRESLSIRNYPGYPTERLNLDLDDIPENLILPEGPWTASTNEHPSDEEQASLASRGLQLDGNGRPLHPWLIRMLTDRTLGVVTGKGKYWNWGPNYAADPMVITDEENPKILLIQRSDTKAWALPGGFIDAGENAVEAAKRELFEEAGLLLLSDEGHQIYSGVIGDLRTTAHAWGETTAVLWKVPEEVPTVAGDDAIDAGWFDMKNLPEQMSVNHRLLVNKSLAEAALVDTVSAVIPFPRERKTFSHAGGGHMAYHRHIIHNRDGNDKFIKSHNRHIFTGTDAFREENSRWYLKKEKFIYDHLAEHAPSLVPGEVELINDHSLMMQSASPEDGWYWRAPNSLSYRYVDEIIDNLLELQRVPLANDEHIEVRPSHITHRAEGWEAIISDDSLEQIAGKIRQWQPYMNPEFQARADEMLAELVNLAGEYENIAEPSEYVFTHHDLRQSNIAWHPEQGTRIVDWSWAGAGRKNSDITTMLIDLHKSGHDIDRHMEHFSEEHALTLIGFWLGHSLWPTRTDDQSVRFHQVLSAVCAYSLLQKNRAER